MFATLTIYTWLSIIPYTFSLFRTCVPNTHFQLNGRVCFCDHTGRWSEANCNTIIHRSTCLPGQIIWEDCSQCICQENGRLLCTNAACVDDLPRPHQITNFEKGGYECTPFRSYYIDCHLCSCPASGLTKEARCVPDISCLAKGPMSSDFMVSLRSVCIPNVMYLFHCLSCMCSENGYFIINKCINTCTNRPNLSCIPGTLFKSGCDVCKCPDNSVPNKNLCTKAECKYEIKKPLDVLRNQTNLCTPHKFTKPKCFYCECGEKGKINKKACYELDCLEDSSVRYDLEFHTCNPGEIVPSCMECLCSHNGFIDKRLCSKTCSFKNKMSVLEGLVEENIKYSEVAVRQTPDTNICEPFSVFIDRDKLCLCPENGDANSKQCTSDKGFKFQEPQKKREQKVINYDMPCTPNTFVDFECNTCYCNKSGQIETNWCTFDDCDTKRHVKQKHSAKQTVSDPNKCTPGSISSKDCNFCLCPNSGLISERVCTKNKCHKPAPKELNEKLYCEPMEYYTVDCNVCFCPHDGLKNVEKCTKKVCEKNFLRSNLCEPGELFGNDCNICVCPSNGDKHDSVCTNHTCSDADTPWKKIFKLTQDLLNTNEIEETTRSIDLCFPGEEFIVGCKVCVCPDMGLRTFASCTHLLCDNNHESTTSDALLDPVNSDYRRKPKVNERCTKVNLTDSQKKECSPGSVFINRCRECICPFVDDINLFCRPLPKHVRCDQPYPHFKYLSPGTIDEDITSLSNVTKGEQSHSHTYRNCNESGYVMDECFICECKFKNFVEKDCFKSDNAKCNNAKPSFLHTLLVVDEAMKKLDSHVVNIESVFD